MKLRPFFLLLSFYSFASFDHRHEDWDRVLKQNTSKKGRQVYFDYYDLRRDSTLFKKYLEKLENVTEKEFKAFSSKQKLAFWINAYNAYTVQIILKNYPLKSIKDIKGGLFSSGPWKIKFINLLGKKMSLDNIEHDTIRENWDEPRIHFAVNCASIGCPSLLQEAFTAASLDQQLASASLNFLKNKQKNRVKGDTMYLSKIFQWYGNDFKKKYGGYKKFITKVLKLANKDYDVSFNDYDWSLNELSEGDR